MSAIQPVASARKPTARAIVLGLLSTAMLAACSPATNEAAPAGGAPASPPATIPVATDQAPRGVQAPGPAPAPAGGTVGGDGSEIQLGVLTESDLAAANLAGELGCNFSQAGGQPLLVAMGVVGVQDPAHGVVKVGSYVEPVHAPGGFNGMLGNPTFSGQGKTIRIEETGAATGAGESPPRPATLTYQRADGASRMFEGLWQCGP